MTATTIKQAEDMGAPSQEEIAAYQQTSAEAQLAQVRASAKVRMPPEAFTPHRDPATPRRRATSAAVAPAVEKPVEVLR